MAWGGTKKMAAPKFPTPQREEDDTKHAEVMSKPRTKRLAARDEPEPAPEPLSPNAKAQLEWHQLKSKKGWTEASVSMLLYEFIASKAMFADLVKFARRR